MVLVNSDICRPPCLDGGRPTVRSLNVHIVVSLHWFLFGARDLGLYREI
jgi:hypothetical protein